LVTVLGKCDFENQHLDESETEEIYQTWIDLIGKDRVKRTTGRRNLFIAKIPGAAGGTGFEVYYKMVNGNYIEIGSQVAYHYIYHGPVNMHKTVNGTLGSGIGLERLLMAIENKKTIYDISLIKPIKDIVIRNLNDGTGELYDDNINIIVDHIRTIIFVIFEKEKQSLELTSSQEKILRKFKKDLESQFNYLGINTEIYEELVNRMIDLYKDRYPDLSDKRDKIIDFLQE
jgi:alanyl-tRNA synthetase